MKLSLSFSVATIALVFAGHAAQAQSAAKPGQQCSYLSDQNQTVPSLDCGSLDASAGKDIRLSVTEYQTCNSDGTINKSDFDRSVMALVTLPEADGGTKVVTLSDEKVKVIYAKVRTHVDSITGANVSLILPTSATFKVAGATYKIQVTTKTALDHEDAVAEESHFVGSYVKLDANGKQVDAGPLECGVEM